jgi:hypothetical protein
MALTTTANCCKASTRDLQRSKFTQLECKILVTKNIQPSCGGRTTHWGTLHWDMRCRAAILSETRAPQLHPRKCERHLKPEKRVYMHSPFFFRCNEYQLPAQTVRAVVMYLSHNKRFASAGSSGSVPHRVPGRPMTCGHIELAFRRPAGSSR